MKAKLKIGVLMGGLSAEHEVSLASGRQVLTHLNRNEYQPLAIKISRAGRWFFNGRPLDCRVIFKKIDLAFLALHGEFGEDGRLQGLLDFYDLPYTGSGRLASALGMDKLKSREIFNLAGLPTPQTHLLTADQINYPRSQLETDGVKKWPKVIKPRSRGSSVGVFIAHNVKELSGAIGQARKFDRHILVEEFIAGREVTCGILENFKGQKHFALPLTEIRPKTSSFFDYQAKYTPGASEEITPAPLTAILTKKVQMAAVKAHCLLDCANYSRADFIIKNNQPYLLEVNTLPGLTKTSLLPQAAAVVGLTFKQLLDLIVDNSLRK